MTAYSISKTRLALQDCFDPETTNPRNIARGIEDFIRAVVIAELSAEDDTKGWRQVAIECVTNILAMVDPKSAIAAECNVALAALRFAKGR